MVYKFIFAEFQIHPKCPQKYKQWFLLLDEVQTFMGFIESRRNHVVHSYMNLKLRQDKVRMGHISDPDQSVIFNRLALDDTRKTLLDDAKILDEFLSGYHKGFFHYGHIIVSPNNSFRMMDDTFTILETQLRDDMIFPVTQQSEIRIIKWPGGVHYYAKIGNTDVVDANGNQKWNSHEDAYFEAQRYLAKYLK